MKRMHIITVVFGLSMFFAGCSNRFFDPTQIGRFRPTPAVNVILDSLGVAEETPLVWEEAEEPRPSDIVAVKTDYILQPGDIIRISIYELFLEGSSVINDYVITETGKISIPDVGVVQAAGLTETQLEEEIKQILSPSILKEPSITVALMSSQQRSYSVLGDGVPRPGRYVIPRYDFRLTDALATAGGPRQFNVSYIYVSRFGKEQKAIAPSAKPQKSTSQRHKLQTIEPEISLPRTQWLQKPQADVSKPNTFNTEITRPPQLKQPRALEREMLEMITPMAHHGWPDSKKMVTASTEMATYNEQAKVAQPASFNQPTQRISTVTNTQNRLISSAPLSPNVVSRQSQGYPEREGAVEWIYQDGKWTPIPSQRVEPTTQTAGNGADTGNSAGTGNGIEWKFQNGKWVPVQIQRERPPQPPIKFEPEEEIELLEPRLPVELEWEEAVQTRLIKIPADRLLAGDPRYNIIIKPGDTIHVPVDIIGEFCIMGNVNRSGYIGITGRPMTLKMAIAAAGGLGPLAWPKYCEVVRRIGGKKEEIVMVDLDKITRGEQPDFFIKPNDLINVGTHPTSRWRAILRNAFRATYGFGFVYDRNFAYRDYYGTTYNPISPWKWEGVF
jgi:protein involved in polysaccharide export with SLBB domain